MEFVNKKYRLDGEAPEGTTVCECIVCKTKYAIPTEEVSKYNPTVCEECSKTLDKIQQDAVNSSTDILNKVGDTSSPADKASQV